MTDVLEATSRWFEKAVPEPNQKNVQTQLGVHFEEVAEMIECVRGKDRLTQSMLTNAMVAMHALALHLKNTKQICSYVPDTERVNYLDAICDQHVTLAGVSHMEHFNGIGALTEVNRSNFSKFEEGEPVFDSNRKIAKGRFYTPPDLTPFV